MRIAIIGDGKMGRAIATLAPERGHVVAAILGEGENAGGAAITRERLGDPEVALEFTEPGAAVPNLLACIAAGIPVVTGTTGWYAELERVATEVRRREGALLWAPNFSIGVALLSMAAEALARGVARSPGFDAHIIETHHAAKKDAPSGTAAALAGVLASALDRTVPVTSVRTGYVPGTHEVIFDAPFEQLRLTHLARDRRVFADGALHAAEWLRGRHGIFTMRDVVRLTEEGRA